MIITGKALPRRTFLRGAGAALSLPLLDAMAPALAATRLTRAKPTLRLGFVYVPNGIIHQDWIPSAEGTAFDFAPIMQPLAPHRGRLNVLSGLAQHTGDALGDGPGDHARAGATWLTGVHPKKTEGADIHAGISADQIAAQALGRETQFASLELGLEEQNLVGGCDSGYSCAYTNTVSWRTPTTPNPVEVNPRAVFERLFGDGDSSDSASRMARMRQESSVLDYVRESVGRLEPGLGPRDKSKLDEYLDGIRDIERRIQKAEQENAANASVATPVMARPSGIPDSFEDHAKLMSDLLAMAFQTDMTRVATYMLAHEGSNRAYRSIGISDGHHSVTHHQNDPDKIAKVVKINTLHARTFAYLVDKLKSTPDGDGSLLDHSLILYGSSISDGNAHTHFDLPLVLVGGGGGIPCGRHIRFPKETPMNNLLLSMLDRVGVPIDHLGDSTGATRSLSEV